MSLERVKSELFVGRKAEIDYFKTLFTLESEVNILNIHTNGDGGIGKTQLLLKMQEYCASIPDDVVFAKELIDFYRTESRSKLGVMQQIVGNLGAKDFPKFRKLTKKFQETVDVSEREELFPRLEETFRNEYAAFAERLKEKKKAIVLFFDTYEFIQGAEGTINGKKKQAEPTGFSNWIETKLFPHITKNTRLIVSGRYPLKEIDRSKLLVEEINLSHFTLSDTKAFWKKCFHVETESKLAEKIGSDDLIDTLHTLADGRPILLALFADWVNYERKPLSPRELIRDIEQRTRKITIPVTKAQQGLFERILIERVTSLIEPEDRAVIYMAVAYRRMTPEMFGFLLGNELSLDDCQDILLERLKPLSFIKYKEKDVVLLHDEMRRLVLVHWWNEQDSNRNIRRDIATKLVKYYDEKLLAAEDLLEEARETYTSELLEYAFLANPQDGLDHFRNEFDIAIEDGRYDYADLLLREAETYHRENPKDIPFPYFLRIRLRRIQYYTNADKNYEQSVQMASDSLEEYKGNSEWENNNLHGHFLMERGIAGLWLENFEKSVEFLQKADDIFYYNARDDWSHWIHNWIGYTHYRQGQFAEAEGYLVQSREGFYNLLVKRENPSKRELRRFFQGIQLSFGNLAVLYNYTGKFERAIRYAEIALGIVRSLPRNNLEIARGRATIGRIFAFAGHAIDARHHLTEALKLLQDIPDRQLEGRIKTDLAFLESRVNEFAYILEYYRAEEIEKIVKEYVRNEDNNMARELMEEAIHILGEEPAIKKELADTHYFLGRLYMVTPLADYWQKSEEAFLESLKWARKSKFLYRVVDTLESLVTLYYFWNGASEVSDEIKAQNQRKMEQYRKELDESEQFNEAMYPELYGKYKVTLGDIEFDQALALLRSGNKDHSDFAMNPFKESFTQYVSAAELMKTFNVDQYYLTLRVFCNRLNTLIDETQDEKNILSKILLELLDKLQSIWEGKPKEFQEIYEYVCLRIHPEDRLEDIDKLQNHIGEVQDKDNFGWAVVLNECLIRMYKSLLSLDAGNDEHREQLILRLNAQLRFYNVEGDKYQTVRCIQDIREELKFLSDLHLKDGLEGYTDCTEGTLKYRKGKYSKLLQFYLQDELKIARDKFDKQFPGARNKALKLLKDAEKKLSTAISFWEEKLVEISVPEKKTHLEERIRRYRRNLGETKFRVGELLVLNGQFDDNEELKGAFSYLQDAIDESKSSRDIFRYDYAMQSYVDAFYFSGKYGCDEQAMAKTYEEKLEKKLKSSNTGISSSIMGRLRITQGDILFSRCFRRKEKRTGEYTYIPYGDKTDIRALRTMVRYYVEACNFMAQQSLKNFTVVVRVLQRRIELISDREALINIGNALEHMWKDQKYLGKETFDNLATLVQWTMLRSSMIEDEDSK